MNVLTGVELSGSEDSDHFDGMSVFLDAVAAAAAGACACVCIRATGLKMVLFCCGESSCARFLIGCWERQASTGLRK